MRSSLGATLLRQAPSPARPSDANCHRRGAEEKNFLLHLNCEGGLRSLPTSRHDDQGTNGVGWGTEKNGEVGSAWLACRAVQY